MKYKIVLTLVLVFTAPSVYAQLDKLIERNVRDSTKSYDQLLRGAEQAKETPRLWVHVRNKEQEKAVQGSAGWLKGIKLGEKTVDLRPIQHVKDGPANSQLRFFKKQDRQEAEQLLIELKKALPGLQLKDFTGKYTGIDWIKPGHYELWLAADANELRAP